MSAAMVFSPTTTIHGPPNDRPSRTNETVAITHDSRVSIDFVCMRASSIKLLTPSLRQRAEEIGSAEQDSRLEAELPEPAVKDLLHLAPTIYFGKRRIDGKPQLPIAARQRDGIGLDRKVVGQQAHSLLIFETGADQQQLVAGEGVDLAAVHRRNSLVAILHRNHDGI